MKYKETKNIYQQRIDQFSEQYQNLQKRYGRLSLIRLLIFLGAAALLVYLFATVPLWGALATLVFLILFYRFIQFHEKLGYQRNITKALIDINTTEIANLNYDFSAQANGIEYEDGLHPYSSDLDIIGEHSLFQCINRTTSRPGSDRLADYLLKPTKKETITQRQASAKELTKTLDWRQYFQAYGLNTEDSPEHISNLKQWLKDPVFIRNNAFLKLSLYLAPLWFVGGILGWIYYFNWQVWILWMIPIFILLKRTVDKVNFTHSRTAHAEKMLKVYGRLIHHIENGSFENKNLQALKQQFFTDTKKASEVINRLSYIIAQLNVRYNVFAVLLNASVLWDLIWVNQLEKWKQSYGKSLQIWFDTFAEFEALSSIASLAYNNPDWIYPMVDETSAFNATALGHPLLASEKRVNNDINIPLKGHIKLITGSNMAGKSTLLRTVGVNIALAQAGAVVCAESCQLPLLNIYTSMRTRDDLHESTSSFYAELKRLKSIIQVVKDARAQQKDNVLFLLDEILKGTNSVDRHTGAKALIQQLIRLKGSGLIATHDLELGVLEAQSNGTIENLCMEVQIKDGELYFDYKLHKGVSHSFNATLLMRQMGFDISDTDMRIN